jgi:leucyl aminopeptidase (aminopeptidase T)
LSLLLLSSCSNTPEKEIVTVTEIIKPQISVVERPKQISTNEIEWYVVTEKNYDEFKKRFLSENGDLVFYVLSVRDYEKLIVNMAEIKRYILQQKEIILYYEKSVTEESEIEKEVTE